jgi:hypothetical protein
MENVVVFYDHLEYFTANWYNLWPFGIVIWYIFPVFWTKKSGNPGWMHFLWKSEPIEATSDLRVMEACKTN